MPVLYAFGGLLIMQLLGEALVRALGVPLPGALVGLLLLFFALLAYGKVPPGLRDTSRHLLAHMMLLFIPPIAGIMVHFDRIAQEWLAFLMACIAGAAITVAVTALTLAFMLRRIGKSGS